MTRTILIWSGAAVLGSLIGFVLLGLSTHSGGILFVLGNLLMPGVFIATLGDVDVIKTSFWTTVLVVQAVYYGLVVWVIVRIWPSVSGNNADID